MEQIRVLVFPCGSEIGLELFRSLKDIRFVTLYGASSVDDHGKWVYERYIGGLPYVTEPDLIERLNACVDEHRIDYIFPAMDSVTLALSEHRDELHAMLLTSSEETVRVCRSKAATYEKLKAFDFVPRTFADADAVTAYPVLVKPSVGQGSQGVAKVDSAEALHRLLAERAEEQVICEYLPGEEYTVDCFTDRHGTLHYCKARVRSRVRNGISVNTRTVDNQPDIQAMAEEINGALRFRGVWFFQLKRDREGRLRLLECATRVAGAMCADRALGVNLPLLTLMDAMGCDLLIEPQAGGVTVDRALASVYRLQLDYDELYMDFDDTLVVHGRVNREALSLIYQCVERDIPVTLLTRHEGDIHADLRKARICEELFARIVEVGKGQRKSACVRPGKRALVIDDSFAERKDMADAFGIPALGVESIEALLDHHQ